MRELLLETWVGWAALAALILLPLAIWYSNKVNTERFETRQRMSEQRQQRLDRSRKRKRDE